MKPSVQQVGFLARPELPALLNALQDAGYRCVGPQRRDAAIVYDTLDSVESLPRGVLDEQGPGHYRIHDTDGARCFAWANGPEALRPLLFAPHEPLWSVARDEDGQLRFTPEVPAPQAVAVLGVRACDLAALALQDRHFLETEVVDPCYAARRSGLFLVAVNCTHPSHTCFCASTGDGPSADTGCDLVLDELDDGFIVRPGTEQGGVVFQRLPVSAVTQVQLDAADEQTRQAARAQVRGLPSRHLRDVLFANLAHSRWDYVAGRCLSCGNCTQVCPTCFCHRQADQPSLDGSHSTHVRLWDSCFTPGHSYIHGSTIRAETYQRYRQWLTHKLGGWHDQYGRSGCVGCGRCITWCPVGIDITEEVTAICRGSDVA